MKNHGKTRRQQDHDGVMVSGEFFVVGEGCVLAFVWTLKSSYLDRCDKNSAQGEHQTVENGPFLQNESTTPTEVNHPLYNAPLAQWSVIVQASCSVCQLHGCLTTVTML